MWVSVYHDHYVAFEDQRRPVPKIMVRFSFIIVHVCVVFLGGRGICGCVDVSLLVSAHRPSAHHHPTTPKQLHRLLALLVYLATTGLLLGVFTAVTHGAEGCEAGRRKVCGTVVL